MPAPAVPTGSVVFLFSDIEGSTRRWERYGEAMREALRRHDGILRASIEQHRGYVFKTIGDAFCASFWNAPDAVRAAVHAQCALEAADFSGVGGLAVRMALHGAEVDEIGGDYFGPAVNRTARLLAAGNAGQILISATAAEACTADLPAGIRLHRMGALPLRDVAEVQDVFEAVGECIKGSGKPLRALIAPPCNLPKQTTGFVGRQSDVAQIESLLESSRLVTIVGAGGIGKTRLAIEAAAARLNDYPDGAWFVDFASIAQPELVAGTIASALRTEPSPQQAPLDALIEYLSTRELLLILDNCEHVISGVAEAASSILERCDGVTQLATSREAIDVAGERLHHLASLDHDAAVRLFNQRAAAADPAFDERRHVKSVSEICTRLDGMALAIELAAARLRGMPVETLARRLNLALLAGGRDRRPRQQTMQALISWSYDLLERFERRTLQSCAVFAGGFTAEQAAVVVAIDADETLDTLTSLVDKSLLLLDRAADPARYRLLEPIREFSWGRLRETGDADTARNRHAEAFAFVADSAYAQFETGAPANWLSRNRAELPNLRAALQWTLNEAGDRMLGAQIAAGAVPIFLRSSLLSEGIDWCENALHDAAALDAAVQARLHYGLSMLYTNLGSMELVLPHATAAAELYRRSGDLAGLTRALSQVAHRTAVASDYASAHRPASEALELARRLADPYVLATTLLRCASAFTPSGLDVVREYLEESVRLFRELGRDRDAARALMWWGGTEIEYGNYGDAAALFSKARHLATDDLAMHLATDVAGCYLAMGNTAQASEPAARALELAWQARHPVAVPCAILYAAAIVESQDAPEAARLAGYVERTLRELRWQPVAPESRVIERLRTSLSATLSSGEMERLHAEGAAWQQRTAVERAAGRVGAAVLS